MVGPEASKVSVSESSSHPAPVVIDLGKKARKQIKQLREGRGKLLDEVNGVVAELRKADSISSSQPVVVVVRPKRKDRSILWPLV